MTAIDMFIMTMTGGNRIVDTTSETVVRRARKTDNDSWFPIKYVNSGTNVAPNTVTAVQRCHAVLLQHDVRLQRRRPPSTMRATAAAPASRRSFTTAVQRLFVDACRPRRQQLRLLRLVFQARGLDPAQRAHQALRSDQLQHRRLEHPRRRRAALKYEVRRPDAAGRHHRIPSPNSAPTARWCNNPDGATGGLNSGVINYINKFSDAAYKSLDPVSELFYESIRYFKHLGPTPEYSAGLTDGAAGRLPDREQLVRSAAVQVPEELHHRDQRRESRGSTSACPERSSRRRRSAAPPAPSRSTATTTASRATPTTTSTCAT